MTTLKKECFLLGQVREKRLQASQLLLTVILWLDAWTRFLQILAKIFKSISIKFWIPSNISWQNQICQSMNGPILMARSKIKSLTKINWVRLFVHFTDLIQKESETGMRSTKLSKISPRITWHKELREIEPFKKFTAISCSQLLRELSPSSREILLH